jgi:hypothetical protein
MRMGKTMTMAAVAITAARLPAVVSTTTAGLAEKVFADAVVKAATAFNRSRKAALPALPEELPPFEKDITQFYGAVGGVLCSTLWDPGSSVNLITPEFAKELEQRGIRWEYCEPLHVVHGTGDKGGVRSAAPSVRRLKASVVLCHQGLIAE